MRVLVIIFIILIPAFFLGIGVSEIEVLHIPQMHLVGVAATVFTQIHHIEVLSGDQVHILSLDGIPLRLSQIGFQVILQFHIRIKGVEFRRGCVSRIVIMHRYADIPVLRQQFAHLHVSGQTQRRGSLILPSVSGGLQRAETGRLDTGGCRYIAQISQIHRQIATSRPTGSVVKITQAQFVHPHLHRLSLHVIIIVEGLFFWITYTHQYHIYIRQIWTSLHINHPIPVRHGITFIGRIITAIAVGDITVLFRINQFL